MSAQEIQTNALDIVRENINTLKIIRDNMLQVYRDAPIQSHPLSAFRHPNWREIEAINSHIDAAIQAIKTAYYAVYHPDQLEG